MKHTLLVTIPLLLLTACGRNDGKPGTDFSIMGDDGNVVAAADGRTGKVAVNLPGISANVRLPRLDLDAENLDIDGVKLYPGSTVGKMDVKAGDGDKDDRVEIRFNAPAALDAVRRHFADAFRARGARVATTASGLEGAQTDGDTFRIDLSPAAVGRTDGMILLTSKD